MTAISASRARFVAPIVGIYAVLVIIGALHHEPWADEAQSWLVARDNGFLELQWTYLRHEGSPGLWHTLLFLPAHFGWPYETSIATIAAVAAIAGVAVFLWHSPLPLWLNALAPFTFFVLYQYAVIARSYCLLLLLLGAAAVFLKTWRTRPLRLCLVLILLAHTSVHGALLSLAFVAQIGAEMLAGWRDYRSWAIGRVVAAIALYAINGVLLLALMWEPQDLRFSATHSDSVGTGLVAAGYYAVSAFAGHMVPLWLGRVILVLCGLTLIWAATRGAVFGLVAAFLLGTLAGARYFNSWHEGALFLAWLIGLWIAWDRFRPEGQLRQRLTIAIATMVISLHVVYGFVTWRQDLSETYSGSRDVARYLKERRTDGQTLWGYDFAIVAVQPYFDRPIFTNFALAPQGKGFFFWSQRSFSSFIPLLAPWQKMLCDSKPDLVLTLRESRYPDKFDLSRFEACGYEIEREFPGTVFFQGERFNQMTYILMRRRAGS